MARVVVYVADRKLRPPPVTFKYSAPAAIMLLGATLSLLRSVAEGQASVLVPIARMGFVVAALLGIFVLREPVTVRKMIGLVAALAGFGGAGQKLKVWARAETYSITSLARARRIRGTSRRNALAVFRLMTSSNLSGC
jgi:EamA-like transporter family